MAHCAREPGGRGHVRRRTGAAVLAASLVGAADVLCRAPSWNRGNRKRVLSRVYQCGAAVALAFRAAGLAHGVFADGLRRASGGGDPGRSAWLVVASAFNRGTGNRSEEHTSELQ